jgi:hypothetical protein
MPPASADVVLRVTALAVGEALKLNTPPGPSRLAGRGQRSG